MHAMCLTVKVNPLNGTSSLITNSSTINMQIFSIFMLHVELWDPRWLLLQCLSRCLCTWGFIFLCDTENSLLESNCRFIFLMKLNVQWREHKKKHFFLLEGALQGNTVLLGGSGWNIICLNWFLAGAPTSVSSELLTGGSGMLRPEFISLAPQKHLYVFKAI